MNDLQYESEKKQQNGEMDTAGIMVLYLLGGIIFVIFSISCIFALIFVAIAKALERDKWLYYASPVALIGLFILFQNAKLHSMLGTLKYAPFINQYVRVELDVWAGIAGLLFGVILAAGFRLYETKFNKKVVSKKDEMDEKRSSKKYEKMQENKAYYIKKAEQKYKGNEMFLGITEFGEPFTITEKEPNQHMLVVGTTGSGKTILIMLLSLEAIKRGKPVIAIDGKGDKDFIDNFSKLAEQEGVKLYVFSDLYGLTYNPIKHGTATMVRDKLMALFKWSNDYYTNHCSRFLQLLILIFDKYNVPRDIEHVHKYCDPQKLMNLLEQQHKIVIDRVPVEEEKETSKVKEVNSNEDAGVAAAFGMAPSTQQESKVELAKEETSKQEIQYKEIKRKEVDSVAQEFQDELSTIPDDVLQGLNTQLSELIRSDLGHLLKENENGIDLRKIAKEKAMVLFSIDGLAYGEYVEKIARLVIMDINNLCSHLYKTEPQSIFAVFDEFSAYVNKNVVDTVNKARGAGLEAVIGTQGLCDIDAVSPALRKQIVNNCNIHVAMRVNEGDEAEALAKTIGTYEDIELTIQTKERSESEMGTSRQVERFKAHPNSIKELAQGEAFIARRTKRGEVKKVYIKYPFVNPEKPKKKGVIL
ncbi:TraM recognition domain-containing protein [Bacillus cereus]